MTRSRASIHILLLALASTLLQGADDVPEWARQAAAQTVPSYPAQVNSVVLFHEEAVTVEADGRRLMRERGAVKILQRSSEAVQAYRVYDTKNGRIRDFQGWLIPPTGKPVPYAKNRIVDVALSQDYVYDEARAKVLDCGSALPGSVFVWEILAEEKTVFTQDEYVFQLEAPALTSRYTLSLPQGWEARGIVFNRDGLEPQVSGNTFTWELSGLPWIERQEYSPALALRVPRLVVSYYPPSENRAQLQSLRNWTAVSVWVSQLMDPAAEVTDAVRAKALQLTANAPGEIDKIRAIAAFAQQTNYVEVSLNVTRGGGYTPHRADETLAKNYGDCKDKSTLMRALLKAVGIESYVTVISASDRNYVRQEWASPMQFNHAIVAVRVSNAVTLPTVIPDSPLGRLLMFDPTDRMTPLGNLPEDEQASFALVLAGSEGALLRMPLLPASANRIESVVEASLTAEGRLSAHVQRRYLGQSATRVRALAELRGSDDLKRVLERGWSRQLGAVTLGQVTTLGKLEDDLLTLNVDLTSDHFGQIPQSRLLVLRPGMLTTGGEYSFSTRQRTAPVELEATLRQESIRVKLPAGFKVDELPQTARVDSGYGSYAATWTVQENELVMDQKFEIKSTLAPSSEFVKVREFFDKISSAGSSAVVLIRQ